MRRLCQLRLAHRLALTVEEIGDRAFLLGGGRKQKKGGDQRSYPMHFSHGRTLLNIGRDGPDGKRRPARAPYRCLWRGDRL